MAKLRVAAFLLIPLLLAVSCARTGGNGTPTAPATLATATLTRAPTPVPTDTPEPTPLAATVSVGEQTLDESGVLVMDEVTLPGPGWLVIYRVADGQPDDIIGQTPLAGGAHENVRVTVDTEMATERLMAGLHMDAGAEGVFEFPGEDQPYPNEPETEFTVELALPQPVVEVNDQAVREDGIVTVARVELLEPGWVLIHADEGGEIGAIIGRVLLPAGIHENVTIATNWREGTPTLYAVLHEDAAEVGRLEAESDLPLLSGGRPVVAAFKAVYPPEVLVYDQPLIDEKVVIERAISDGPGWVVVHADDNGQPGFIIGSAPLADGLNEQVTVELLESAITTQLYSRIHHDTEPGDDFNYPGSDPVVLYDERVPRATAFRTDLGAQVYVNDQDVADGGVTVKVVITEVSTWVVIHGDDGGQLGAILGQTLVPPGINRNVVVALDSVPSGLVHLALYLDGGAAGRFEAPGGDPALANDDGRPIRVPFTLLSSAGD